jgi:hypothetical protein
MRRLFFVGLLAVLPAACQVAISAKPEVVELGEQVTLDWKSPGTQAFLDGVGPVSPSGSLTITPRASMTYTLVSEGRTGISYASVRVHVTGERGESVFPDPDDFPPGVSDHRAPILYTDFLTLVFKTLQDGMKFRVRGEHLPSERFYVLFTERQAQADLLRRSDRGIRSRRVAYWVKVEEPRTSQDVSFQVRAIVEFQRAAEAKWNTETDQQLVTEVETRLKEQLLTTPIRVPK